MAEYYDTRPSVVASNTTPDPDTSVTVSEFDKHRESLLSNEVEEGWVPELRRYLETMHRDIKKDADIVEWWQVSAHFQKSYFTNIKSQNHADVYPTLARIALDVLPSQASSVPCERLFSGTKQTATDRRARLGPVVFEQLTIMDSAWKPKLRDAAAWNSNQLDEVVDFPDFEFEEMLVDDRNFDNWAKTVNWV